MVNIIWILVISWVPDNQYSKVNFSCQPSQSVRYVHNCLELVIPFPTSANKPSWKSVVLESSAQPSLDCQCSSTGLVWQKIQEPLTQDANMVRVLGGQLIKQAPVHLVCER